VPPPGGGEAQAKSKERGEFGGRDDAMAFPHWATDAGVLRNLVNIR
jgi:hypothetical protein